MFLPESYKEVPTSGGRFMKFKQGDNIFRILSSAIVGWEKWTKVDDKREVERFQIDAKPDGEGVKHFWAFIVWNYTSSQLELLHITQSGIQKDIKGFVDDVDWGDPKNYDLVINRVGENLETEYTTRPKPMKDLSDEIITAFESEDVDLEKVFTNESPFIKDEEDETVSS